MSGDPLFMATELLSASLDEVTKTPTLEHDLESVCFVIIYALYTHALRNTKDETHWELWGEFAQLFRPPANIETLTYRRVEALGPSTNPRDTNSYFQGIRVLLQHVKRVDKTLGGFLKVIWRLLKEALPKYELVDEHRGDELDYGDLLPEASVATSKPTSALSYATLLKCVRIAMDAKSE